MFPWQLPLLLGQRAGGRENPGHIASLGGIVLPGQDFPLQPANRGLFSGKEEQSPLLWGTGSPHTETYPELWGWQHHTRRQPLENLEWYPLGSRVCLLRQSYQEKPCGHRSASFTQAYPACSVCNTGNQPPRSRNREGCRRVLRPKDHTSHRHTNQDPGGGQNGFLEHQTCP